ncbi:MAG: hypothetical protein WC554_19780, partial [Clostridia bacterium]
MAEGRSLGTVFVELDLDPSRYTKSQQQLYKDATQTSLKIEDNFKKLNIKSSAEFDLMRQKATNAFEMIAASSKATSNDIYRAQQAHTAQMKRLNEQQYGHQTSMIEGLKKNWMAASAAIVAAWYAASRAIGAVSDVVLASARYETLGIVMRTVGNNAGYTGAQMESFAQGLEKTGISMTASREALARMVQAQLDLTQSSKLARIAQDAAVIGNINSSEAFTRLIYGIQSARVEMLRTIGINVNFENSYQRVAKETGRVATSFSESEKAAIRMNTVLESGVQIAGTYEAAMETAGKQLLSMERHFENLKVLAGEAFTPALAEIVEVITGSVVGLNGELSGESRDAIHSWGVNFRIALISVEAEIMRLGMLLDKFGGTLTSAKMLLYGPGRALGFESSTKRFEAAADANIEYENRYKATDKALEALALKQIKLEESLTDAGKARHKAELDALEKKRMASAAASKVTENTNTVDEKAAKEAQKLHEFLVDLYIKDEAKKWEELEKYEQDYLAESEKMMSDYYKMMRRAHLESLNPIEKIKEAEKEKFDFIKSLQERRLLSEEEAAKARILIEQNSAKEIQEINQKLLKERLGQISDGFGALQSACLDIASVYAEGSESAKKWEEAARAMEIAQRAVVVVQAVAAIATQGLGDPYTAFVRIAAMA